MIRNVWEPDLSSSWRVTAGKCCLDGFRKAKRYSYHIQLHAEYQKKNNTINRRLLFFLQSHSFELLHWHSLSTHIFFSIRLYGLCLEMMNSVRSWIQSPMRSYVVFSFFFCNPLFSSLKDIASRRLLERLRKKEKISFQEEKGHSSNLECRKKQEAVDRNSQTQPFVVNMSLLSSFIHDSRSLLVFSDAVGGL